MKARNIRSLFSVLVIFGLTFMLCTGVFADNNKMNWHYPQPDDDMIYHWELEKNGGEVDFSDIAMYISFDVADSGKQHLIKANWLPELDPEEAIGILRMDQSFYDYLSFQTEHLECSDIYGKDIGLIIGESGLSEDEAQNKWFTEIQIQTADTYPYRVEIFDNFELSGRDLIQGAYGAEALSVEDGELNGLQIIKASIEYTNIYDKSKVDAEEWALLEKSIIKNYIYLFDNECEYMICISGTSDMETLEKIGENIEVYETGLERNYYNDGLDYIFNDMARG